MKPKHAICKMLAALALLAISVPVTAFSEMKEMPMKDHHMEGHGQMMGMGHMDKMDNIMDMCIEHIDKMGLSDDQVVKMKPIHREMQKKQVQYKADLKLAEIGLMEIMELKDFDLEKANIAFKKIADITTAHHMEILKAMKEIRASLTEEQFKKMQKMTHKGQDEKKPPKNIKKKHNQ